MNFNQMDKKLRELLSDYRYAHSVGVMETAMELSERFGADTQKAKIAGLLHDCAKEVEKDEALKKCEELNVFLDDIKKEQKGLIHADLGAAMLKPEFEVDDEEIFGAVKYHTLGRENMTLLEKIIYVSDLIEPNRKPYEGLDELRIISKQNIDEAMLVAINIAISFVKTKGKILHSQTLKTKEYIESIL